MYFADATKAIWFNMSPCKSSFVYAGGKTESVYAAQLILFSLYAGGKTESVYAAQ